MNILRYANHLKRNNPEIYTGFGLHHLSSIIDRDNEELLLSQTIAEAIQLFSCLLKTISYDNDSKGCIYYQYDDGDIDKLYFDMIVPDDFKENNVIDKRVSKYRGAWIFGEVIVGAYDENDELLETEIDDHNYYNIFLAMICTLIIYYQIENKKFAELMWQFVDHPSKELFIQIYEAFYHAYYMDNYITSYESLKELSFDDMEKFTSRYYN